MRKIFNVFLLVLVILGVISFVGCTKKNKAVANSNEKIMKKLSLDDTNEAYLNLNLYFDGSENDSKAEVGKEERIILKEELIGEIIMQELIKGPSMESQLKPIFPKDVRLISVSIKDKIVYVNLSAEAKNLMEITREEACLKSLTLSLTQLESVDKVKILIDNKNVDVLGGNFDISKPFSVEDITNMKK
ncbi:GerMN domain-containing protein [Clostridium aestuarii]|uniref:GerMN domain-containing protein n=1 Tax=Clostridium aestuarii TaxID=338193 RepID=A0ABT4D1X0_9CLOT|nr:GerMN domain-containing protein [Clostridium aestuarii]MCY6485250.1 GerMN domain-containing protein [Clostridium aestuarii]